MAKVAISINEVLRDFIGQFIYTYEKYIVPEFEKDGVTGRASTLKTTTIESLQVASW